MLRPWGGRRFESPELDWRGKVYLGSLNVLFHVNGAEPAAEDYHHRDAKGNPTGWFLSARAVETALGIPAAQLQETWMQHMTQH